MKNVIALVSVVLLLFLQAPIVLADPDLNSAAADVCKCLKEPYAQAEKAVAQLKAAQAAGDNSAMAIAQGDMMGVLNSSNRCFDALPKKYPEIDASVELQDKVMALADKQCPNPFDEVFKSR